MNDDILYKVAKFVDAKKINICETYNEWLQVAFSCASAGENGRDAFHLFSMQSTKYDAEECNAQFNACWKSYKGQGRNYNNIFALLKRVGVSFKEEISKNKPAYELQKSINKNIENKQVSQSQNTDLNTTSSFSLPCYVGEIFLDVLKLARTAEQQEAALISFIAGCSACCPKLRFSYDGRLWNTNFYYMLIAPAASGKSIISTIRGLFADVQKNRELKYNLAREEYKKKLKETAKEDRELLEEPKISTFFLPADTTAPALLNILKDNGGEGIIWESELDTLTRSIKGEYGGFDDLLRNNWGGEPLTYTRKIIKDIVTINNPQMSAVLAGTEGQFPRFIRSAENGLFSRFLFGSLPLTLEWANLFEVQDKGEELQRIREKITALAERAKGESITIQFTAKQKAEHTQFFERLMRDIYPLMGGAFVAQIRRLGVCALKLASTITYVSNVTQYGQHTNVCNNEAFQLALFLVQRAIYTAAEIYNLLPVQDAGTKKKREQEQLYNSLPSSFALADLPQTMSQATKYRLLGSWQSAGMIIKEKQQYKKIQL